MKTESDIDSPTVVARHVDAVSYIRLNRPEKRNALNRETVDLFRSEVERAGSDESTRMIVIEGEGSVFCAGADLAYLRKLGEFSFEENLDDSSALADAFSAIIEAPVPVVARVHGHAIAGGCGLATVCDISVAVAEAKFGYTEVGLGFIPAIVTAFLLKRAPQAAVRELLLTGRIVDGREAFRRGLVTTVVGTVEELDAEIAGIAERLRRSDRGAVAMTKQMIAEMESLSTREAIELGARLNAEARMRQECKAGIARFLDRAS